MKKDRPIDTLEDAVYELIHSSVVPAKAQAEHLGVSYTRLLNSCLESAETAFHHTRWIIPQTLATRNFVLLDYLEMRCGRVAFTLPEIEAPKDPEKYRAALMQITAELGEAAGILEKGLAVDGELNRREKATARQEAWDVVIKALALHRMLED